jgi:trk system potassium uptake protein TrkH
VIGDVSALPKSYLYYRAQLNFIGGLGVIVLAVAVLPLLGIGGMKLYQSEMPGPFKEERLTPRLADTARTLWVTYLILGIACTLAYWLAGMPFLTRSVTGFRPCLWAGFRPAARASVFMTATRLSLSLACFHCSPRSTSPSGMS